LAAENAARHSSGVKSVANASLLLSLSKLCSVAAMHDADTNIRAPAEELLKKTSVDLAILRATQIVIDNGLAL
jgi:hypothetical protein